MRKGVDSVPSFVVEDEYSYSVKRESMSGDEGEEDTHRTTTSEHTPSYDISGHL